MDPSSQFQKGTEDMPPPARGNTDTRTQIMEVREQIIEFGGQMREVLRGQETQTEAVNKILEILQGNIQTPGVLQRLTRVEDGLRGVKDDLCEHVAEHKKEDDEEKENARDVKKRRWSYQDGLSLALLLFAVERIIEMFLRSFGVLP